MKKTKITGREIQAIAAQEMAAGKSRSDIIAELAERHYDQKTIAAHVNAVPIPDLKAKYKSLNTLLVVLLVVVAATKLALNIALVYPSLGLPTRLFLAPFIPAFATWLAVQVWRTQGFIYGIIPITAFAGIIQSLPIPGLGIAISGTSSSWYSVLYIVLLVIAAGLSAYLNNKMFPHRTWFPSKHRT